MDEFSPMRFLDVERQRDAALRDAERYLNEREQAKRMADRFALDSAHWMNQANMHKHDAAEARRLLMGAMNTLYECVYEDHCSHHDWPTPRQLADDIFEFLHTPPSKRKES